MTHATTATKDDKPTLAHAWRELASQWQALSQDWMQRLTAVPAPAPSAPDAGVATPWTAYDAAEVTALNQRYAPRFASLWSMTQAGKPQSAGDDGSRDRRFAARAWREQPYFAFLKDAYLLYGEYLTELAALAKLPAADKQRLRFATQQYVDAIAPTNFPATNPEVMERAFETEGASLVCGFSNLLGDARKGRITMSDERAFEVGRNIATTPGSVVFRNDLIELIQYDATTPEVHARPLLIVPPCINKFYILDLRPENSFVRHAVAQGHTVFMISWRNVPQSLGRLTWDDYLEQGVLAPMRVAMAITKSRTINTLGFCVGGTLLGSALAVLAARNDASAQSVTLLTTMLDFSDPGDIRVYISPEQLAARTPALLAGQRIHGSELAGAFASLRANDLVWHYVVNNYMKGQTPPAFDLLYWNGDSTNLPGPMYAYYLKSMYIDNQLREPGALTMLGEPIDLGDVTAPTYVVAAREDHIVPWRTAYETVKLVGGDVTFVLGASGHIAGVVNPPMPQKRNHWRNDALPDDADAWLATAQNHAGSWWPHWYEWLARHAGEKRPAPTGTGSDTYPALEPAPGHYVRASAD